MINWTEKRKTLDFFLENAEKKVEDNPKELELLKLVSDTDHLPRIIWDNNTTILYANKPFLDNLGYEFNDVVGKKFFNEDGTSDFITPDTLEVSKKVVVTNASSGVKMIQGANNKWYNKLGEEVNISWLKGFNDTKTKLGSSQCFIVTWNKDNRLCPKCRQ